MSRLRGFVNYVMGDAAVVAAGLLLFMWLFRVCTPEAFGAFALAQAVVMWLQPLVGLAMNMTAPLDLTQFAAERNRLMGQLVRARVAVALVASGAVVLVALFCQPLLKWTLIAATPLLVTAALQLDFACTGPREAKVYRHAYWIISLSAVPLTTLVCTLQLHPATIFLAQLVAALAGIAWQWRALGFRLRHLIAPAVMSWRRLAKNSLYGTMAQFAQSGYHTVDLLLLGWLGVANLAQLGEYRLGNRLILIGAMPLIAGLRVISGDLATAYHQRQLDQIDRLERLCRRMQLGLGAVGALLIVLASPHLLGWIAGRPLPLFSSLAPWIATAFFGMAWQNPYMATLPYIGLNRLYLVLHLLRLAIAILLCILLIPLYQILGAAAAIACASLLLVPIGWWQYRQAKGRLLDLQVAHADWR